jgi:hypothetical protein
LILWPLAFSGKTNFLGGGYWQSAAYALWDSLFAVGMCLALTTFFRRYLDRLGRLGRILSPLPFTVYVIHIPIIVLLGLALRPVPLEHLLKFALAAIVGVPLCFAAAYGIAKVPFASRILVGSKVVRST